MVTHLAPSVVNTLTRPDPARVYRTCTKRISLESSLKELSYKTITKSMGVSMNGNVRFEKMVSAPLRLRATVCSLIIHELS